MEPNSFLSRRNEVVPSARVRVVRESTIVCIVDQQVNARIPRCLT
jgi:hypothetical protein